MIGRDIFRERWGATFITEAGSFHSYRDFGLLPAERPHILPAEGDRKPVKVPAANGRLYLRLTDWPTYDAREGVFSYFLPGTDAARFARATEIMGLLHEREARVILDEDPGCYYTGILAVSKLDHVEASGQLEITGELDPYKYELTGTAEDWLWDPFDFETGIIREYGGMTVSGSRTVEVWSSPRGGSPAITSSAAMTMTWDGTSYSLQAGENVFPAIELPHSVQAVTVTFTGTGTVSIDFRAGYLSCT